MLSGHAVSLTGDSFTYLWTVEPVYYLNLSDSAVSSSPYAPNITIDAQQLYPYVTYTFTLQATNRLGSGSAQVHFTVIPGPISGGVTIGNTTNGGNTTVPVIIGAPGWEPAPGDGPLQYLFGYVDMFGKDIAFISDYTLNNKISAYMVPGTSQIWILGRSASGATRRADLTIDPVPFPATSKRTPDTGLVQATAVVNGLLQDAVDAGDTNAIGQQLFIALRLINQDIIDGADNDTLELRADLRQKLAQIADTVWNIGSGQVAVAYLKIQFTVHVTYKPVELNIPTIFRVTNYLTGILQVASTNVLKNYFSLF